MRSAASSSDSSAPMLMQRSRTSKSLDQNFSKRPPTAGPGRTGSTLDLKADGTTAAPASNSSWCWRWCNTAGRVEPTLQEGSVVAAKSDELAVELALPRSCGAGRVKGSCDRRTQHTITWSTALTYARDGSPENRETIEPGSINLYKFPLITPPDVPGRLALPDIEPSPRQAWLLQQLLLALLLHEESNYAALEDSSGARPIHALLIANSKEAMSLFVELIRQQPARMLDAHGKGIFHGENCMHVLCVQEREAELLETFAVVTRELPRSRVLSLLTQQADGAFFRMSPVDKYGSTPISYACVSGMKAILVKIFEWDAACRNSQAAEETEAAVREEEPSAAPEASGSVYARIRTKRKLSPRGRANHAATPSVDVNSYDALACRQSGFLPLHCLVALRMPKMLHWLCTLPDHPELGSYRAAVHMRVAVGTTTELADLTPLQLATRLGDRDMVRFLIGCYSKVDWKWGSLTQKRFDLAEIDSVNPGASNVMELIVHVNANPRTCSMLGIGGKGDFMQGFVHELFVAKFESFCKYIFYVFFLVDGAVLVLQIYLAMEYRGYCGRGMPTVLVPLWVMLVIAGIVEVTIIVAILTGGTGAGDEATRLQKGFWLVDALDDTIFDRRLRELRRLPWGTLVAQFGEFNTIYKFTAMGLTIAAALIMHQQGHAADREGAVARQSPEGADAPPLLSYLDSEGSWSDVRGVVLCASNWPQPDLMSFLLALAIIIQADTFIIESLNSIPKIIGVESLGMYPRFIRAVVSAVSNWLIVFGLFLGVFSLTMHIMYPVPPQFRHITDAVIHLWLLATTGEPIEGFPPTYEDMYAWNTEWPNYGVLGSLNGIGFLALYIFWIYFSMILLLNLLIAIMGYEFDALRSKASLEYRLGFARRVLRAEQFAMRFFVQGTFAPLFCGFGRKVVQQRLRVGQLEPGTDSYYYSFVEVGRNAEGRQVQEGEDIFADNSDSDDDNPLASTPAPARRKTKVSV